MTQTTALSTRIAHLEALALPLLELRSALDVQHVQRDEVQAGILEAERAQQQLDLIGLHVGAVLDGHPVTIEITGGAELPDLHEIPEPESPETEASQEPVQEDESAAPAVPPETTDQPTEDLEPEPQTSAQRVLAYLALHPHSNSNEVADATGMPPSTANSTLSKLRLRGQVSGDDSSPRRYALLTSDAPEEPEAAAEPEVVAETPVSSEARARTPDERAVLERMADGALYSVGHLIHHLGIARTRVERATNGLSQDGLIGRRGDLFVVIPKELTEEGDS